MIPELTTQSQKKRCLSTSNRSSYSHCKRTLRIVPIEGCIAIMKQAWMVPMFVSMTMFMSLVMMITMRMQVFHTILLFKIEIILNKADLGWIEADQAMAKSEPNRPVEVSRILR